MIRPRMNAAAIYLREQGFEAILTKNLRKNCSVPMCFYVICNQALTARNITALKLMHGHHSLELVWPGVTIPAHIRCARATLSDKSGTTPHSVRLFPGRTTTSFFHKPDHHRHQRIHMKSWT